MDTTSFRELFQDNLAHDTELPTKQKQVLQAALDLFAAQGFANTTTKQIAAAAEVSEGTVYKRFKTKDQLLAAVLRPLVFDAAPQAASEFQTVLTARPFDSISDLVTTVAQDRFQFVIDNQKEIRIIFGELLKEEGPIKDFFNLVSTSLFPAIYSQFDQLKERHKLVSWDNDRILHYLVSVLLGYGARTILLQEKLDVTQIVTEIAAFFERGLAPD